MSDGEKYLIQSTTSTQFFFYENSNGNADSFKQHINDELFPLIENNYRTLPLKVAVGHSNSASFVSHCFL